jgi:hypothetical protein
MKLPRQLDSQSWTQLQDLLITIRPFEVEYGPVYSYPGICGVVLRAGPAEILCELVETLEAAPAFKSAPPRKYPFSPHMTIAEFITLERTQQLCDELSPKGLVGSFACNRIAYAVPDAKFHFKEVAWLDL